MRFAATTVVWCISAIYVVCSLFYAVQYALFGRLLTAVQSLDVARNRSDEQHDYTPNETANHATSLLQMTIMALSIIKYLEDVCDMFALTL